MNLVDKDFSGNITIEEFEAMMRGKMVQKQNKKELISAFSLFDSNMNGFLQPDEFKKALKKLGLNLTNEEIEQMLEQADSDLDGVVNFDEFEKIMKRKEGVLFMSAADFFKSFIGEQNIISGSGFQTRQYILDRLKKKGEPVMDDKWKRNDNKDKLKFFLA